MDVNYIAHHGIKGQKWGIRRYQNPDGSLTPEGIKRYGNRENFERKKALVMAKKKREELKKYKKNLLFEAANVYKMSDEELFSKIGRLEREKRLIDLTYDRVTSSADPRTNMLIQSGKKVALTALTGALAYAGYKVIGNLPISKFRDAAAYMFPNPNKKSK